MNDIESTKGEIVMYQPDETIRLEVRVENETVWLTQQQMAELFMTTRNNITLHIGNIFKEGELIESSVRKDSLLTAADGNACKRPLPRTYLKESDNICVIHSKSSSRDEYFIYSASHGDRCLGMTQIP